MWEHIYCARLSHVVLTRCRQELQVTRLRGGIATDIHDTAGSRSQDRANDIFMHPCTWWVGDDDIGSPMLLDKLGGEYILHIASIEECVVDLVDSAVDASIIDGLGDILNAND